MRLLIIISLSLISGALYCQKKDFKAYDKAFKYFKKNNFDKSKDILDKIYKILDEFTGKNRQLGDDASIVVFQLD